MLYGLKLPKEIIDPLKDIVRLQMVLLSCAARAVDIEAATPQLKEEIYISELQINPELADRSEKLVKWMFKVPEVKKNILAFAEDYTATDLEGKRAEKANKRDWCQQLAKEVEILFDEKIPVLTVNNFFGDKQDLYRDEKRAPQWKKAARGFLLYFYENYLGKDTKFPKELFADPTQRIGRKEFLDAFLKENQGLEICPICDQTHYYTYSLKEGKIHATLDHFLPKSLYPHFACHPYNLVPTCHRCNSSTKGDKDPFLHKNRRRSLSKRAFPYHGVNLRAATYLEVDLSTMKTTTAADVSETDNPKNYITLGRLRLRDGDLNLPEDELQGAIDVLSDLYEIPALWGRPGESNRIRATLFRRMRQFLGNGKTAPQGSDMPAHVHNLLHLLLYYLNEEYQQKDPHAFAMTWMLVAFMREHTQQLVNQSSENPEKSHDPFLEEIVSWYGQSVEENAWRAREAAALLKIPTMK